MTKEQEQWEHLVAACVSLAGAKVLLEQGRAADALKVISAAYDQLNGFLALDLVE